MPLPPFELLGTARQPVGAGFDLLLLAHVACVLVAAGAVVTSGVQARRLGALRPGDPVPESLCRYFAEGTNWAGRALYGVPLFGAVLLAVSGGYYSLAERWLGIGLGLWFACALVAEVVLWPRERRLQTVVGRAGATMSDEGRAASAPLCAAVARTAALLLVVLLGVSVLMVAQPG